MFWNLAVSATNISNTHIFPITKKLLMGIITTQPGTFSYILVSKTCWFSEHSDKQLLLGGWTRLAEAQSASFTAARAGCSGFVLEHRDVVADSPCPAPRAGWGRTGSRGRGQDGWPQRPRHLVQKEDGGKAARGLCLGPGWASAGLPWATVFTWFTCLCLALILSVIFFFPLIFLLLLLF